MKKTAGIGALMMFVLAVFVAGFLLTSFVRKTKVEEKIIVMQEKYTGKESLLAFFRETIQKKGSAKLLLSYLDELVEQELSLDFDVQEYTIVQLLQALPKNLEIMQVEMKGKEIVLQASAQQKDMHTYYEALKKSGHFAKVILMSRGEKIVLTLNT